MVVLHGACNVKTTDEENERSGYNVFLVNPLPERLKCPLCRKLIRDPIQTERGELACYYCYTIYKGDDHICPIDHEPISPTFKIFKDRFQALQISQLVCVCIYAEYGCHWQGIVAAAEEHQSECAFTPPLCCFCQTAIPNGMQDHFTECTVLLSRGTCLYEKLGCLFRSNNGEELVRHLQGSAFVHISLQNDELMKTKDATKSLKNLLEASNEKMTDMEMFYEETTRHLKENVESLMANLKETKTQFSSMKDSLNLIRKKAEETTAHSARCGTEGSSQDELKTSVTLLKKKISFLDLKQQLYENTSMGGTLLWKIDNISQRRQQSVAGTVTAVHSAPCFTKKYAYKFCGRLYLNGDGIGKNNHISLFLVVMKSEYDNLLEWPFSKHVLFRLINQEDFSKSLEQNFLPDPNSSSFQKPTKEMNTAAGCPLFIKKESFFNSGFVKDDSLFIEISAK